MLMITQSQFNMAISKLTNGRLYVAEMSKAFGISNSTAYKLLYKKSIVNNSKIMKIRQGQRILFYKI